MAESSERDAGKPVASGAPKTKGRRVPGGRVVESRYLDYEKKTKKASVSAGGKSPEGIKTSTLQKTKEDSLVMGAGALQSTMLEGHSTPLPSLDLSSIKDTSMLRTAPQPAMTKAKKAESTSCATRKKTPLPKKKQNLQEIMDMMESQTLLMTLLSVKMEKNLTLLEEKAEKELAAMDREKERLQQRVLELRRKLLLQQKHQELATILDAQIEALTPFQAVAERFKEQYKTLATALDATRHELPVRGIHMQGSGQELLDELEPALKTTLQLLGKLGICSPGASARVPEASARVPEASARVPEASARVPEASARVPEASARVPDTSARVLCLLEELKDLITKKDLELNRIFSQVMELSSLASKEAALVNQEVWEEALGTPTCSQWYFGPDALRGPQPPPGQD